LQLTSKISLETSAQVRFYNAALRTETRRIFISVEFAKKQNGRNDATLQQAT